MVDGLMGRKLGMTQLFDEKGELLPVTVVEAGPCQVVKIRTRDKEGYTAAQLSFEEIKEGRLNRPRAGHFKKSNARPSRFLREFRGDVSDLSPGQMITADVFRKGDRVDVVGVSKGKGFQGVIKRHHYAGGPATHGSMFHRAPGSIGASSYPSRVWKGKGLPGQMGNKRITVKGLEVIEVRAEENLILLRGAVPGPKKGLLILKHQKRGSNGA